MKKKKNEKTKRKDVEYNENEKKNHVTQLLLLLVILSWKEFKDKTLQIKWKSEVPIQKPMLHNSSTRLSKR